jgi:hypothetical protein
MDMAQKLKSGTLGILTAASILLFTSTISLLSLSK